MSIRLLRDEYVARFGALDDVARCEAHDELFDIAEMSRQGAHGSPYVRIIVMEGDNEAVDLECGDTPTKEFTFVAVVACRSHEIDTLSPGDAAMVIAGRIVHDIEAGPVSVHSTSGRPRAQMGNASTSKFSRQGHGIWVVTWKQEALVKDDVEIVTVPLRTVHTSYDFDKDPAAEFANPADAEDEVTGLSDE